MSPLSPESPRRPAFADELAPLVANLGDQPGAQRLGESLALAEGFHFYLVTCETPSVAAALKLWLEGEVPRRREEAIHLVRLSPRPFDLRVSREALSQELLVTSVLEPLFAMSHRGAEATVVLIDATATASRERDLWLWLFQRLNERRNSLTQRVQAPVVLCLAPDMEVDFVRAAPDLWSVRGLAVQLRGLTPPWIPALAPLPGEEWDAPPEVSDRELEEARAAATSEGCEKAIRKCGSVTEFQGGTRHLREHGASHWPSGMPLEFGTHGEGSLRLRRGTRAPFASLVAVRARRVYLRHQVGTPASCRGSARRTDSPAAPRRRPRGRTAHDPPAVVPSGLLRNPDGRG